MQYIPMTDAELELQAKVTKDASFNGAALDMGENYAPGGLGQPTAAVVDVTALDKTTGDETYSFKLQQSDNGSSGWADCGVAVSATAVGVVVVKGLVTTRYIRLVLTVGGTTPSIEYAALLGF